MQLLEQKVTIFSKNVNSKDEDIIFLIQTGSKLSVHAAHNNNNTGIFLPSCMFELL